MSDHSTAYQESFANRHNSSHSQISAMLKTIGVSSVDELIEQTIPSHIRRKNRMQLPVAFSEAELAVHLNELAAQNKMNLNFIGQGYYGTRVPGVILRNILENPGWYTAYTPYQAEIAQGRLEALLNYQTMVIDLTGMEIANASLLDEATAAAEAMNMMYSESKNSNANKFFVSDSCFKQTLDVLQTRANPLNIEIIKGNPFEQKWDDTYFGAFIQYPDANGEILDYRNFVESAHASGVLVAVAADLLALTLLTPPGEWGADIVLGSTQRFGVPMGYGGPHAAYFATRDAYKRQMPGRIIGISVDAQGNRALRMALQTREQHIRREKATSNICTAQVLLSIMASMYTVYHGPEGIKQIANRVHSLTHALAKELIKNGIQVQNKQYFDTLTLKVDHAETTLQKCISAGINIFIKDGKTLTLSIDETHTLEQVNALASALCSKNISLSHSSETQAWQAAFSRNTTFMQHPVFNSYHSEHEMLRYIKQLESKDLSLCHSMIPLGSCTMKLNATAEMIPITNPAFCNLHPFVPQDQAKGYSIMFDELSNYLKEITGFHGISLQPNSGAQGEYAGLITIRNYFLAKGEGHRNIALIPSSAHGTNPASAVMAGMQVVVTKTLENGYIDIEDLRAKAEEHKDNLACLMVTYPSTYGVFEEQIMDVCDIIHKNGGQVYMDGANMNAQVGLTSPATIGADVCHLNLHKTFCIPHGGGGPGMGPIGVAEHLTPYLPGHAIVGNSSVSAVSAAPWGSADILFISYAYIRLMGTEGLENATKYAIMNANYIKARLEKHYDILFVGSKGRCAHEMILDTRKFKHSAGVEVEDIAKRLMDYGFHAPTVSFPVAGTVMIEPTESEPQSELDRFCDAMIAIRAEIEAIESGKADKTDNVLKNAPHTAISVMSDAWNHAYTRENAAYPLPFVRNAKFWPSVGRVNNSYGDRNLVCACLPIEAYASSSN